MRTSLIALFVAFATVCQAKGNNEPSQTNGSPNAQNIQAIIRFLEAHRLDLPAAGVPEDGILGSKEDENTFRVTKGIEGADHENLKKCRPGKGWYYFATIKQFKPEQSAQAREFAMEFSNTFSAAVSAEGFQEVVANPWPSIVMFRQIDDKLQTRIWTSYTKEKDGIWVTLRIGINPYSK